MPIITTHSDAPLIKSVTNLNRLDNLFHWSIAGVRVVKPLMISFIYDNASVKSSVRLKTSQNNCQRMSLTDSTLESPNPNGSDYHISDLPL